MSTLASRVMVLPKDTSVSGYNSWVMNTAYIEWELFQNNFCFLNSSKMTKILKKKKKINVHPQKRSLLHKTFYVSKKEMCKWEKINQEYHW